MKENARYLRLVGYTRDCPTWLLQKVCRVPMRTSSHRYILRVLRAIKEEFSPKRHIISTTSNIALSRLFPVRIVLLKRLATCGATATVVAAVFRKLGYPTKLVDGWLGARREGRRHAWNEIWLPDKRRFQPYDITRKSFRVGKRHQKRGTYLDWTEWQKHRKGPPNFIVNFS